MKRITWIIIVGLLLLTACQNKKVTYVGDVPNVALIVAKRGDMAYNDVAIIGMNVSERDHGTNLTILEHENNPDNYDKVFMDAVNAYNHVVMMSSNMKETLEKHADKYPEIKFLLYDGEIDWSKGDFSNVYCIVYRANEASYLSGYLAAAMSKTGVIGFLGVVDNTNIDDLAVGYIEGAKKKNPDIKIMVDYAGSFDDVEKGKNIASQMIGNNADIIFGAAGSVNLGILEVLNEKDLYMIGTDTDQYMRLIADGKEDLAENIITSVMKNISHNLYDAIGNYTQREVITGETKVVGLKEDGVAIAKNDHYKELVPAELQSEIDTQEKDIISGKINVPTSRALSHEEVEKLIESVKP